MTNLNGTIQLIEKQRATEEMYSRQNIVNHLQVEMDNDSEVQKRMCQAVQLLEDWLSQEFYESKQARLETLRKMDLTNLVNEIMLIILPMDRAELMTSVVGRMAGILHFSDKMDGIKTLAEILAVICETNMFDIFRNKSSNSLTVKSNYDFSAKTKRLIQRTKYLPPMICEPVIVECNSDTGYLTTKGSLILGNGNHHEGNIALDVINKFNQIPLSLDIDILRMYEEMPKKAFTDSYSKEGVFVSAAEKEADFDRMLTESYQVYIDLVQQGNQFYLTHKKDKRGRTYAQGYHVSTQGSEFKKAIVNFTEKVMITGVPQ